MAKAAPAKTSRGGGGLARLLLAAAPWAGMAALGAMLVHAHTRPRPGLSKQMTADPDCFEELEPGRGRLATHPLRIPYRGWKDILWRTYREVGHDRLPQVAGGVTFYMLVAIVPAIGAFVSIYGLFADVGTVSKQLAELAGFLPRDVLSIVGDQMMRLATQRPASLSGAFLVSLLLSLWTANAGMGALFDGLNVAYNEKEKRPFALRRPLTYGFTAAALLFMIATTAILVALPLFLQGWPGAVRILIPLRWLLLLGLASWAFAIIYRYGPSRRRARWRWVSFGAVLASIVWVGGSLGFSWYVNNIARIHVTYGSLGAVIGFMTWIWFSVMTVLVGAELNAEIEHQTAVDTTVGAPRPMGERGAAMADTVGLAFVGFRKGAGILWRDTRRQVGNLAKPLWRGRR
ncbi:YihY/virulence factor BrkB family protein [Phenylobacterium sp.]|uniref:YihY/virulence factor BrkB family protein n=1 Tax=Phenylobacterium sp. TaxID=1871053 RepID=UPI002F9209F4